MISYERQEERVGFTWTLDRQKLGLFEISKIVSHSSVSVNAHFLHSPIRMLLYICFLRPPMTPHFEHLQNFTKDVLFAVEFDFLGLGLFGVWRHGQKCQTQTNYFMTKNYIFPISDHQGTWKMSGKRTSSSVFLI